MITETISFDYQQRIYKMLRNMKPGDQINIKQICKPENFSKFQHTIKTFIINELDGKSIMFANDDLTQIKRNQYHGDDPGHDRGKNKAIAQMRIRRREIIEWWITRLETPIDPFHLNSAEFVSNPDTTIRAAISQAKHARIGTHVFNAWVGRLEILKTKIK